MADVKDRPGRPGAPEGSRDRAEWESRTLGPGVERQPEGDRDFSTVSSLPIDRLYTPEDLDHDVARRALQRTTGRSEYFFRNTPGIHCS